VHQYQINPQKVQVIPEGAPFQSCPELSQDFLNKIKKDYQLEPPFMLYPAITWPHKNHIGLLEALAHLRDKRNLSLRLVCVGARHDGFWPHIERRIYELKLESQVRFLGFVAEQDLRAIYRLADFLIEPSLFEASSLPIFEAWSEGTPIACSDVTALPEQVSNAGLLFDPNSVESIADAISRMAVSKEVRETFRARGYQRLNDFDWKRTAKAYRAVYRRAARFPLSEEDRWLLEWDWMSEPNRKSEIQ
jgi:glycosyltransferase involved in cell wall biosynthesis